MLTKEERAAIAERLRKWDGVDYYNFYRAVTDKVTTTGVTLDEDSVELSKIILDLCDTSNMLELPVDKDGEVIHIGDVVYDDKGRDIEVYSVEYSDSFVFINASDCDEYSSETGIFYGLTHNKPESLDDSDAN